MAGPDKVEGRQGVARVEAFSDGVLAIIITIMVLELHAPEEPGLAALWHLWPTFVAYVLSYAYVAIYWVNHHRLFGQARLVTNGLLWSNIALLFTLSLLPFSTAYLGRHPFDPGATALYAGSLLLPALAYAFLQREIARSGSQSAQARRYHRATQRKGFAAAALYALAIPLSWWAPAIGVAIPGIVALFWIKPWSRIDSLFLGCEGPEGER
jgi:uncharacterized membrane protein